MLHLCKDMSVRGIYIMLRNIVSNREAHDGQAGTA